MEEGQSSGTARREADDGRFRDFVLGGAFPCLGGAAAVRRGSYQSRAYTRLGGPESAQDCARDLLEFTRESQPDRLGVAVFVAFFRHPTGLTEPGFERALWEQLAAMRRAERALTGRVLPGRPDMADDPGFVFAGRNYFVVGLHPAASRLARRFESPTLVFNSLSHGDPLQRAGHYETMTARIRARDVRLQGSPNPSLDSPRVAQFSGRRAGPGWTCPVPLGPADDEGQPADDVRPRRRD